MQWYVVLITITASIFATFAIMKAMQEPDLVKRCTSGHPCKWVVYDKNNRYERVPEYTMLNNCVCREDQMCLYERDELGIGAFVYKCGTPTTTTPRTTSM